MRGGPSSRFRFIPPKTWATIALVGVAACATSNKAKVSELSLPPITPISGKPNVDVRPFEPTIDGRWVGAGISYGAYREGEAPGDTPPKANILEDLQILSERWNFIRIYGSGEHAEDIMEVIRDNELPILVMQGIWLGQDQSKEENDAQVQGAIDLAQRFPEIICAVNVGNEIFVDWSAHRMPDQAEVIAYIRQVRAAIRQPVTVNDDYNFWNKPESKAIADEIDFIGLHGYAFWNDKPFVEAHEWTKDTFETIQAMHPEHLITFNETGWPTKRIYGDGSYEGGLVGKANEENQKAFFDWFDAWVKEEKIISLYFEAFDESWKGGWDGAQPADKAEKHWGLYKENRSPKAVME
ncbi:MAG: glycosyl hydrolase family 17 [Myxococcota bacterium]